MEDAQDLVFLSVDCNEHSEACAETLTTTTNQACPAGDDCAAAESDAVVPELPAARFLPVTGGELLTLDISALAVGGSTESKVQDALAVCRGFPLDDEFEFLAAAFTRAAITGPAGAGTAVMEEARVYVAKAFGSLGDPRRRAAESFFEAMQAVIGESRSNNGRDRIMRLSRMANEARRTAADGKFASLEEFVGAHADKYALDILVAPLFER
jgi:hypothetical protein